jgi:hypothetical protein
MHIQAGTSSTLAGYYEAHNAYVHQLRGTNAMLKEYQSETLPALLQVRKTMGRCYCLPAQAFKFKCLGTVQYYHIYLYNMYA